MPAMSDEDDLDLDFTKPPPKPAPPPPPQRVESAKKEAAASAPELARTGFYVAMARRPAQKVVPLATSGSLPWPRSCMCRSPRSAS